MNARSTTLNAVVNECGNSTTRCHPISKLGQLAAIVLFMSIATTGFSNDLLSSLDLAWSQDPALQSAAQNHQTNLARVPQARAALLPVVNFTLQNNASKGSYGFAGGDPAGRTIRTNSQTLQLTQPIYRPQLLHALAQSELQAVQSLSQLQMAEQDMMLRLVQAYADLAIARINQDVAAAQLKVATQFLAVSQRGLQVGSITLPDVYEAQSRLGTAQAQVIEALTQWRIKRHDLVKITGELPEGDTDNWKSISDDYSLQWMMDMANMLPLAQWMEQGRIDSPSVRAQMIAVEIALREIRRNRAAHWPTLDLTLSRAHNTATGNATNVQNYDSASRVPQLGLQLVIPIYAGGGTDAKIREASNAWNKTQFDLESAQQLAETSALQAFENAKSANAQVQAYRAAIDSAQLAVQANTVGIEAGSRTPLDLYKAQLQLVTAQRDWRKARYDLILQTFKLRATSGLLDREDIQKLNEGFTASSSASLVPSSGLH